MQWWRGERLFFVCRGFGLVPESTPPLKRSLNSAKAVVSGASSKAKKERLRADR